MNVHPSLKLPLQWILSQQLIKAPGAASWSSQHQERPTEGYQQGGSWQDGLLFPTVPQSQAGKTHNRLIIQYRVTPLPKVGNFTWWKSLKVNTIT